MKRSIIVSLFLLLTSSYTTLAQEDAEQYGKTVNLGVGIGYYGYVGRPVPVVSVNYEIDVVRNFTLAPFIGFYTYNNNYYWGDYYLIGRNYSYRETVVPLGVKGTYYFDELFRAGTKWDFYASADLGFAFRRVAWESGYTGNRTLDRRASALYVDIHIGSEYHMNERLGLYLDLSTGVSTIGVAFHF